MLLKESVPIFVADYFWTIDFIQPIPCPFEGKDFYDARIISSGGQKYFCKWITDYKWERLAQEFQINQFLYVSGLATPKPLFYFSANEKYPISLAFYQFLDWYRTLKDQDLALTVYLKKIAESLFALHSLPLPQDFSLRTFGSWTIQSDFLTNFNKKKNKILAKAIELPVSLEKISAFFLEGLKKIEEIPYVLCKKDMHAWNWMVNDITQDLVMIDNEFLQYAPLYFDFYEIFSQLLLTKEQQKLFLSFYGETSFSESSYLAMKPLIAILKSFSWFITFADSKNKDSLLRKKAEDLLISCFS